MGVSLRQIEDLLGVLLPADAVPDHSTLGRWVQAEATPRRGGPGGARPGLRRAGRHPGPRRDLFRGRPTLVGIEPASMTAVFCRNTADRKAATWEGQLAPFSRLEFAVSDAAKGIASAVAQPGRGPARRPTAPPLEHGLDVFHTAREARRVLARHWQRAEAAWEKAEAADAGVAEAKRQGIDARGLAGPARAAWRRAVRRWRRSSAWRRPGAGPPRRWSCSTPRAGSTTAPGPRPRSPRRWRICTGPEWTKVRNFLSDPRSTAFLDRMHRRLEAAEPRPEWREAMAWRWWLRHGRVGPSDPIELLARGGAGPRVGCRGAGQLRAGRGGAGGHGAGQQRRGVHEQRAADAAVAAPADDPADAGPQAAVLELPGVPLGAAEGRCPYRALGLELPSYDFWELLHADPAQLTQQLSTQGNAD